MTIPEILSFKFTPAQLSGFKKGYFDPSGTKFVAYSVLPLKTQDIEHELSSLQSYGYDHSGNYEKTFTIDNGDGTFSYKELSQLIEEGVFTWVAIKFYGVLYEGDWYSRKEVTFYEKGDEVTIIEKMEEQYNTENADWDQHYFALVPPFQLEPDFGQISEMASRQLNEQLTLTEDYEKVMAYYKTIPKGKTPTKQIPQYPQYREFIGIPWLVAFEKQENKERNNLH
ncbi:MAG TPA: hypothetical protein VEV87_10965, partial [Chitinophagaceae bacterium]|nr:hypothetical protein [Chitinophagaceae bacterium]